MEKVDEHLKADVMHWAAVYVSWPLGWNAGTVG